MPSVAGHGSPCAFRAVTKVERPGLYCIVNGEFRRYGAAGARRSTQDDERPHDVGAVLRRGGVNGWTDKVIVLIPPEDGLA